VSAAQSRLERHLSGSFFAPFRVPADRVPISTSTQNSIPTPTLKELGPVPDVSLSRETSLRPYRVYRVLVSSHTATANPAYEAAAAVAAAGACPCADFAPVAALT
jgi:hypothetical protein